LSEGFIGVGDKACLLYFFVFVIVVVVIVVVVIVVLWFYSVGMLGIFNLVFRGGRRLSAYGIHMSDCLTTSRSSANVQCGLSLRACQRELCGS
jgi:hypothetical protein